MAVFVEFLSIVLSANSSLAVLLLTIALLIGYWYLAIPRGVPPGPLGLPILGYLPFLGQQPQETLDKLAKKYGPIFRLYFGNQLVVVLNDYESVKEAFIKQAEIFSGRPKDLSFSIQEPDKHNIVTTDGRYWREHRRFALSILKDCGVGKIGIEPQLMNEIQHFINEVKQFSGQPKDFSELLALSVANNICILAFGMRFDYKDPWFVSTKRLIDLQVSSSTVLTPFVFFPWLKHVPGVASFMKQKKLQQNLEAFKESMYKFIAEQRVSHLVGQRNNYTAAFIEEQKVRQQKLKDEDDVFTDEALEQNMRTLMTAGTETTANTLLWTIIYMILHPDIQNKVQNEIDEVIGQERTPSWNDRLRTPYTEATLYEVQRMSTLVPLSVPHRNKAATEVLGHQIPKNSYIVANLWAIHNDPRLWGDPQNFRPERFLSANGEIVRSEHLIPFSIGKRQCPGEILAKMELYLYFTAMLQKFTFQAPRNTIPSLEPRLGITFAPKEFIAVPVLRSVI